MLFRPLPFDKQICVSRYLYREAQIIFLLKAQMNAHLKRAGKSSKSSIISLVAQPLTADANEGLVRFNATNRVKSTQ